MASQSRSEPRKRLPRPSPVLAPFTSAAMSTISNPVYTSFFEFDILPSRSTRSSGTCASATVVSVVENWCGATTVSAPVSALNKLDLPLLGRPTSPRRSMRAPGYRRRHMGPSLGELAEPAHDVGDHVGATGRVVEADLAVAGDAHHHEVGHRLSGHEVEVRRRIGTTHV